MKTKLNASIQCVQDRPQDVSNDDNNDMDVDSNGQVGVSDAIFILRTIVGLEQLDALVQISVG